MRRRELLLLVRRRCVAAHSACARNKSDAGDRLPQHASAGPATRMWPLPPGTERTGYVEGQNVAIEYRWAEGRLDRARIGQPTSLAAKSM